MSEMTREDVEQMLAHKLSVLDAYCAEVARTGEPQVMLWSDEDRSFEPCQHWFANRAWFKRQTLRHLTTAGVRFTETTDGITLLP